MQTTARLLITMDCIRKCPHCCNGYTRIMEHARHIRSLDEMDQHDIICITGGEPQLRPDRINEVVGWARAQRFRPKVFMYATIFNKDLWKIIKKLDGIHYSLHNPLTDEDSYSFQAFAYLVSQYRERSFRLYVDAAIQNRVDGIIPEHWKRIEFKHWQTEDELLSIQPFGIPAGETMYVWEE